jgi:4-hydroxy-tetrahydrodipicolinate synthase
MFSGSIPALVTPFRGGTFDERAYRSLIDWQVESGSTGLVPCGTTGESATMTIEEHDRVVSVCVEQAAGRVPVIAGCGSNDTRVALEHMRSAKRAGRRRRCWCRLTYNRPFAGGGDRAFRGAGRRLRPADHAL